MDKDRNHGPLHGAGPALRDGVSPAVPGPFSALSREPTRAELLAQVAALEGKLASLPAIEQAKGALMVTYGITADAAFAVLRFHSQTRNVKVRAIAAQLPTLMCSTPSSAEAICRCPGDQSREPPPPGKTRLGQR
jgi:hypothetical protein